MCVYGDEVAVSLSQEGEAAKEGQQEPGGRHFVVVVKTRRPSSTHYLCIAHDFTSKSIIIVKKYFLYINQPFDVKLCIFK